MAESEGFEPSRPRQWPTRFPIVLLRPARTALHGSTGRIRTYDRSVNSRLLYHWATVEWMVIQRTDLPNDSLKWHCLATSYSCKDKVLTTISAEKLNFCVRYGNRCDLFAIATRQSHFLSTNYIICIILEKCKSFSKKFIPKKLNKSSERQIEEN